jgi:23S rRNA (cytosine1962-C5)-methyltransferase
VALRMQVADPESAAMKSIRLHEGKERSLLRRHPWVFQGSVDRGKGDAGETVRVEASNGRFLAWAAYSPASQIRLRAWSFDEHERIDHAFFKRRIDRALALRQRLAVDSDGVRLIHGEADGLPGLIVDCYADVVVAQFLSAGSERWKQAVADILVDRCGGVRVYERSDSGVRELEGLAPVTGWLRGEGETKVRIREHRWQLDLDVASGHKTGYYLDQRDNRARFAQWVRRLGCTRVLNAYCYSGGFSVAALDGGAQQVVSVDSSAPALERVNTHVALNGFEVAKSEVVQADVNAYLREAGKRRETFDAIVLDPPKFAPTAAHADRAARAYKDVNRLALKLLSPGGLLFTFSCSGGVGADLFHKIVAGAGIDAEVDGAIVERLHAAADHPTTICFPEGEYLKGLAILKQA